MGWSLLLVWIVLIGLVTIGTSGDQKRTVVIKNDEEFQAYTLYNQGVDHEKARRHDQAMEMYLKALQLKPDLLEALNNLGGVFKEKKDLERAEAYYQKLLEMSAVAGDAELQGAAYNNLGLVSFLKATSFQEHGISDPKVIRGVSIPFYSKAKELDPGLIDAYFNLGNAYQILGEDDLALQYFMKTLAMDPNHIKANMNLGNLYIKRNRFDLATVYHKKSLDASLGSDDLPTSSKVDSWNNLGQTRREFGDYHGAMRCHQNALELDPANIVALTQGIVSRRHLCLWANWDRLHHYLNKLLVNKKQEKMHGNQVFKSDLSPYDSLLIHPSFLTDITLAEISKSATTGYDFKRIQYKTRKDAPRVNVGYLSYDMTNHPMGYLTHGLFANHNRELFKVFVYMYGERDENATQRKLIESSADVFVDMLEMASDVAATRIVDDEIDIIIDLMSHTRGGRMEIVAAEIPAPIYVNYLGYPGTSGFLFDGAFTLVDRIVAPYEYIQSEITEQIVYLPDSYQANEYNLTTRLCTTFLGWNHFQKCRNEAKALGGDPSLFRFANFNSPHKLEPLSFEVWMNILRRVPRSVLYLLGGKVSDVNENMRKRAAFHGIDPNRIIFVDKVSKQEHLDRLSGIDLFLDSFVYGAHSTASDVLWAGIPMLTVSGKSFPSRVGASLLNALQMNELITYDLKDYENVAVEIGLHSYRILALKQKLNRNLLTTNLFNTAQMTRHVEYGLLATMENKSAPVIFVRRVQRQNNHGTKFETFEKLMHHGVELQQQNRAEEAKNVYARIMSAADLVDVDQAHVAAQSCHLYGLIVNEPSIIMKAINMTTLPTHRAFYYGNMAHVYREQFHDFLAAKDCFIQALWESLHGRNANMFSQHFESLVHLVFVIPTTLHWTKDEKLEILREILSIYNQFAQQGHLVEELHPGVLHGLDTLRDFLVENNRFEWAAQLLRASTGLTKNKMEAFRRLYQVGALLTKAGKHEKALNLQLETALAQHRQSYQPNMLTSLKGDNKNEKKIKVAFYCYEYGQTWWPNWGPRSPKENGAGGSEEAVIFLSQELVKLGYHVTVYADPLPEDIGVTEASGGVVWAPHTWFDVEDDSLNIFVAWRYHISLALAVNAKRKYLWVHDVVADLGPQIDLLHQRNSLDLVLAGSSFHVRSFQPSVQAISRVLGYALQEAYFEDGPNLDTEFIYASAPNRGLEQLLQIWPKIYSKIGNPQVRLRIFYGFSKKFMEWGAESIPNFHAWVAQMNQTIKALNSYNVEYVGMVQHTELAKAYAHAGFTLYPTSFPETGCVSLMKAQAMGAIPITSRFENSSIPDLTRLWDLGPPMRPSGSLPIAHDHTFLQEYAETVIQVAKHMDRPKLHKHRSEMIKWARENLLWSSVARTFQTLTQH